MLNLTLHTYKDNKSLIQFIKKTENEFTKFITFGEVDDTLSVDIKYYVDITSLIDGIQRINERSFNLNIEQSIVKLFKQNDVIFIIKEELSDFAFKNYIYLFSDIEKLCEDAVDDVGDLQEIKNSEQEIRKINSFTESEMNELIDKFNSMLIGHTGFKIGFEKHLREFRLFNQIGEHKILSLFIFGTSGIGKTEVARILHKLIAPSEKMIKINFGNYTSQGAINSLIGSPRGYIGSEDGELNLKLDKSKSSVILIDEFDRADKAVANFFLELLEDGKYTDMLGKEHNLDGYIIIFTSNLSDDEIKQNIVPAFLNRINYKVKFNFLNETDKQKYLNYKISDLINKFNEKNDEKLDDKAKAIFNSINVSKYNSIRYIEQEIKKKFIDIVDSIEKNN